MDFAPTSNGYIIKNNNRPVNYTENIGALIYAMDNAWRNNLKNNQVIYQILHGNAKYDLGISSDIYSNYNSSNSGDIDMSGNTTWEAAYNYGQKASSTSMLEKSIYGGEPAVEYESSKTIIGPFRILNGQNINRIYIADSTGTYDCGNNGSATWGDLGIEFSTDKSTWNGWNYSVSNPKIPNDTGFYLRIDRVLATTAVGFAGKEDNSINWYRGRMVFLSKNRNTAQQTMIFAISQEPAPGSNTLWYNMTPPTSSLTIHKVDNSNNGLKSVGFMIFNSAGEALYTTTSGLTFASNTLYSANCGFTWNHNDATIFCTGEDGKVKISNLPNGVYSIGEIFNEHSETYYHSEITSYEIIRSDGSSIEGSDIHKDKNNIGAYGYNSSDRMPKIQEIQGLDFTHNGTSITVKVKDEIKDECTLKITKKDGTGLAKQPVGFIIFRANSYNSVPYGYLLGPQHTGNLEYNTSNGWGFYTDGTNECRESAQIFYTDTSGHLEISKIPSGSYYIGEVYNNNAGFESSSIEYYTVRVNGGDIFNFFSESVARTQDNLSSYRAKMPYTQTIAQNISPNTNVELEIVDGMKSALLIKKYNQNGSGASKVPGKQVQFIIRNSDNRYAYINEINGEVNFVDQEENAYHFETNDDGEFSVLLPEGDYELIEVDNPNCTKFIKVSNGVKLSKPTGSSTTATRKNSTTVKIQGLGAGNYTIEVTDYQDTPTGSTYSIEGRAFVDGPTDVKVDNTPNGRYDSDDRTIRNAKVYLVKKNNRNGTSGYSATTDEYGMYTISGISSSIMNNIEEYCIKIDVKNAKIKNASDSWENIEYKKYSKAKSNYNEESGAKFIEYKATEGTGFTYYESGEDGVLGLTRMKDAHYSASRVIKGVNLGVIKISAQETVTQDIDNIKIMVNHKEYTYTNGRQGNVSKNVPTVNYESVAIQAYTRNIYPSDIRAFNGTSNMSVKVTYAIRIKNETGYKNPYPFTRTDESEAILNQSSGNTTYSIDEEYTTEDTLQTDSLLEEFDNTIYTLSDTKWTTVNTNTVRYNGTRENLTAKGGTKDNTTYYITFEVRSNKINEILSKIDGIKEATRTKVTVNFQHKWSQHIKYTKSVYHEGDDDTPSYTTTSTHTKNYTETPISTINEGEAPFCVFKLPEKTERTISGNVFEDTNIKSNSDHELIGNGMKDSGEENIKNVSVKLIDMNTGNMAKVYRYKYPSDPYNTEIEEISNNEQFTDSSGNYTFRGIVPGDYYVLYTYGDGTQKIGGARSVFSSQYKSTIVTDSTLNYNDNSSSNKWYLGYSNNSMAVDVITDRVFMAIPGLIDNLYQYGSIYQGESLRSKNINARTPNFEVGIEFEGTGTVDFYTDSNIGKRPSYSHMDFGIIKMPVISLNVYNTISNIKITLSNGQVLTQGDPRGTESIAYISTLDVNDGITSSGYGRGGYVKAEIDTTYLYGSTLEVTYDIQVLNNSDKNYRTTRYYYYGKHDDKDPEYTVFINEILEFVDPEMTYMDFKQKDVIIDGYNEVEDHRGIEQNDFTSGGYYLDTNTINNANKSAFGDPPSKTFSKVIDMEITGNNELYTLYSDNSDINGDETNYIKTIASITTSKLLSTEDDDLEFKNVAELVKITTDKDVTGVPGATITTRFMAPTANNRSDYRSKTTDTSTVTLTPPTGLAQNRIIIIVSAVGLIIFALGVIFIKKKVLNK